MYLTYSREIIRECRYRDLSRVIKGLLAYSPSLRTTPRVCILIIGAILSTSSSSVSSSESSHSSSSETVFASLSTSESKSQESPLDSSPSSSSLSSKEEAYSSSSSLSWQEDAESSPSSLSSSTSSTGVALVAAAITPCSRLPSDSVSSCKEKNTLL